MRLLRIFNSLLRKNMSRRERHVRMLVGALLIVFAIVVPTVWGWIGLYPLLTGFAGSSPLYLLLGIQRHHNLGA